MDYRFICNKCFVFSFTYLYLHHQFIKQLNSMKTYRFTVIYLNDKRQTEIKARSEDEAIFLLYQRAKRALMIIVSIENITII